MDKSVLRSQRARAPYVVGVVASYPLSCLNSMRPIGDTKVVTVIRGVSQRGHGTWSGSPSLIQLAAKCFSGIPILRKFIELMSFVLCPRPEGKGVVLELQHSSISEEERISREAFYSQKNRMFWLINMARNRALSFNFGISLNFERKATLTIGGKDFYPMVWMGRGSILEKWKGSTAHVFLNYGPNIYYLATKAACKDLVEGQKKGEFSIAKLTLDEFLRAVKGE